MTEQTAIVTHDETVQLGSLQLRGPGEMVNRATVLAQELAKIVNEQKLFSNISGRKYVRVEGWNTLGAMLGIVPREVSVVEHENGDFEAVVELVRASDGAIIGRGSAILGADENTWKNRARYAKRSMAITRATGKAFRIGFSWIMALAGYEATPAEEMDGIIEVQATEVKRAPRKDKNGSRPYAPATVRDKLISRLTSHTNFDPSDKQRQLLRHALELCFAGDDASEDKRHTVLHYLTGKESTNDVTGQEFKAIIEDWLQVDKDSGGEYVVNTYAQKEAQAIYAEALREEGQQELSI